MPDYQKMYALLCGAASDAVDLIEQGEDRKASALLREALLKAEDMYIEAGVDEKP